MLKRLQNLIVLGVLSSAMITSNTLVFAEDELQTDMKVQISETQAPETQVPETQAPETQPPETQTPETQAPETQVPETQSPETQSPETQAPETQVPETQAPETQAPETQAPETQTPGSETHETDTEKRDQNTQDDKEKAAESEETKNSPYSSNEELISHQNIISIKPVTRDFRFQQIEAQQIVIKSGCSVYEEKSEQSRAVGKTTGKTLAYILADAESEWVYIESGECRGFIEKENIIAGNLADFVLTRDRITQTVKVLIPLNENKAVTYTKTSVYPVITDKVYGIAKSSVSIYADRNTFNTNSIVGMLPEEGLAYILKDCGTAYFIESGNVRGFVSKESFVAGDYANAKVSQKSENSFQLASEKVSPEENPACYYTLLSVKEADDNSVIRTSIVNFALQFVGNPYVWGGTSLTNGADCSGFVQSIYANYGYSIPRVACDQAVYGTQIPVSDAEPGDLIFYAEQGYVYHVSMYIGNGQVVQAYSSSAGIITSDIGGNAVWATRII